MSDTANRSPGPHFIHEIIEQDISAGKNKGQVVTRFPPRTQRLPPRRARQIHRLELHHRQKVRGEI
jgi:hypothetical protein